PSPGVPGEGGKCRLAHAFTLFELLVSLLILSVLTLAIGSAFVVATRAVPDGHATPSQVVAAGAGADVMARELYYAQSVTAMSPTSVTFSVAPRGTDTVAETITYSWSGKTGDPLLRQYT